MTFILRWPAILVLLALVLLCFAGALAAAGLITDFQAPAVGVEQVDTSVANAQAAAADSGAAEATWIDVGLLAGAGRLLPHLRHSPHAPHARFLDLAFRLCLLWRPLGVAAAKQGDIVDSVRSINPQCLSAAARRAGRSLDRRNRKWRLLAIVLVVGLIILIIDAADRAHWDRQGA